MLFGVIRAPIWIETDRLVLKSVQNRDFKAWSTLRKASEAHLRPWEPSWPDNPHSRADWRARISIWRDLRHSRRGHVFHLWHKNSDDLLGAVSFTNVQFSPISTARVGYWLGTGHTGNGYMSEAVIAGCDWAFRDWQLARIEAATLPENLASQAVLKRAGFEKEGFARSYLQICGKRRDHVLYAKLNPRLETDQTHDGAQSETS